MHLNRFSTFLLILFFALLSNGFRYTVHGQDLSYQTRQKLAMQEQIYHYLSENGDAPVIVRLAIDTKADAGLSTAARRGQRDKIEQVQERIQTLLEGKDFSNLSKLVTIPYISLVASQEALETLASSENVEMIYPDELSKPILDTSVTQIGGTRAFQSGYTGEGQTVVILDTGSDIDHEFLTSKIVAGACFSSNVSSQGATSLCPSDAESATTITSANDCDLSIAGCGHGTHVAGIAAGKKTDLSGSAIEADIIPIQVFSEIDDVNFCGSGSNPCVASYSSDQAEALEHIYLNLSKQANSSNLYTISSANMSLGSGLYTSDCDTYQDDSGNTVTDARKGPIDNLRSVGIATIIASGNGGSSTGISSPACISSAISVAAVNSSDDIASFSNTNSLLDLLAPGVSIYSSYPTSSSGYDYLSGTSMAAPHVTGAWALMKQKDPNATVDAVLQDFQDTGVEVTDSDNSLTFDRIQVDDALSEIFDANIAEGSGEGWRFLSSPAILNYSALLEPLWTQGPDNSDAPSVSLSESNVLLYDGSASSYVSVSDLNTDLSAATGIAVNVYPDDNFDETADGWPKNLSITGMENIGDISVDDILYPGADVFTLLGNPYNSTIDFDLFTNQNNIGGVVYVYDHDCSSFSSPDEDGGTAGGCFKAWNGSSGGLTDGLITAFQGFLVYATGSSPTLTIPESSKTTGGTFHKENSSPAVASLQFTAIFNNSLAADTWFSFTETGSEDRNRFDAPYIYPLDYKPFLSLRSVSDGMGYLIKNLPINLDKKLNIPLTIEGWEPNFDLNSPGYRPQGGEVVISWNQIQSLPDSWTITLTDHDLENVIDLKKSDTYSFVLSPPLAKIHNLPYKTKMKTVQETNYLSNRFTLTIYPEPLVEGPQETPSDFNLSQNYPNPFNPSTVIRYSLPEASRVELDIYTIDGQKVATLVDASQHAGNHTVTFNGSNLSSGVYIYRLSTERQIVSRKMILVK